MTRSFTPYTARVSMTRIMERTHEMGHRLRRSVFVTTCVALWFVVATTTAAASTDGSRASAPVVGGAMVDGLATLPGVVIESPPPPPTETIEYYAVDAVGST